MKTQTLIICILFTTAGLTKASLDFTLSSPSDGLVTIGYQTTNGEQLSGMSLLVNLSHNATAVYTDIISIDPFMNVYIDFAYTYELSGGDYITGTGHPFAKPTEPGAIESPSSTFSISMGYLDISGSGGALPDSIENLITFRIQDGGAGFSYVTIQEDTLRGGVAGDNINSVTYPDSLYVNIPEPATIALLALGGLVLRRRR